MAHPTHDKGDLAEAAITFNLISCGYTVFKPLTQNTFADLVVFRNNKLESVQVKYISPNDGKLQVRCQRRACNMHELKKTYNYCDTPLNWIGIYTPDNRICYLPRRIWENKYEVYVYIEPNRGTIYFNNFLSMDQSE